MPAAEIQGGAKSRTLPTSVPASVSVTALSALRAATWPCHQRLEKRLDVKHRFADRSAYGSHLARMWGFCAGLELSIDTQCLRPALEDYPLRGKLPWLESDLRALGYSMAAIVQLPACQGFTFCIDTATAFGRLYVLEGASLGGRTLLPQVYKHLGCSPESGAAFLASYGANVQAMWQRFGAALDAWCTSPERTALSTSAAIATFEELELWLCGDGP